MEITQTDRLIVMALQREPRMPWTEVSRLVGVDPSTCARRWERLIEAKHVWWTSTGGTFDVSSALLFILQIACAPQHRQRVALAISGHPQCLATWLVASDYPVHALVRVESLEEFNRYVDDFLGSFEVISGYLPTLVTHLLRQVGLWRLPAVSAAERKLQAQLRDRPSPVLREVEFDALDEAIFRILGLDGRATVQQIWQKVLSDFPESEPAISQRAVSHRLQGLSRSTIHRLGCQVSQELARMPYAANATMTVRQEDLPQLRKALDAIPNTTNALLVSGPTNVSVAFWLSHPSQIQRIRGILEKEIPRITDLNFFVVISELNRAGKQMYRQPNQTPHPGHTEEPDLYTI